MKKFLSCMGTFLLCVGIVFSLGMPMPALAAIGDEIFSIGTQEILSSADGKNDGMDISFSTVAAIGNVKKEPAECARFQELQKHLLVYTDGTREALDCSASDCVCGRSGNAALMWMEILVNGNSCSFIVKGNENTKYGIALCIDGDDFEEVEWQYTHGNGIATYVGEYTFIQSGKKNVSVFAFDERGNVVKTEGCFINATLELGGEANTDIKVPVEYAYFQEPKHLVIYSDGSRAVEDCAPVDCVCGRPNSTSLTEIHASVQEMTCTFIVKGNENAKNGVLLCIDGELYVEIDWQYSYLNGVATYVGEYIFDQVGTKHIAVYALDNSGVIVAEKGKFVETEVTIGSNMDGTSSGDAIGDGNAPSDGADCETPSTGDVNDADGSDIDGTKFLITATAKIGSIFVIVCVAVALVLLVILTVFAIKRRRGRR